MPLVVAAFLGMGWARFESLYVLLSYPSEYWVNSKSTQRDRKYAVLENSSESCEAHVIESTHQHYGWRYTIVWNWKYSWRAMGQPTSGWPELRKYFKLSLSLRPESRTNYFVSFSKASVSLKTKTQKRLIRWLWPTSALDFDLVLGLLIFVCYFQKWNGVLSRWSYEMLKKKRFSIEFDGFRRFPVVLWC